MQSFDHLGSKIFQPLANGGAVPELGMFLTSTGNIGIAIGGQLVCEIDADGSIIPGNLAALVLLLQPYYAVLPPPPTLLPGIPTTNYAMAVSEFEVSCTFNSANRTITLPPAPVPGQHARVGDGSGIVLGGVAITVQGADGVLINGQATHVIDYIWGCATYRYSGDQWNIVGLV